MPRTPTTPHADADEAPGHTRADSAGGAPAATKAPAKAAPASDKAGTRSRPSKAAAAPVTGDGAGSPAAPERDGTTADKAAHAAKVTGARPARTAKASPAPVASSVGYGGDAAFLAQQREALLAERATYLEQARSLRAEAESLVLEMEPGDVQFDDESGEGGTTTVDRERDLALSNQALAAVEEIDAALDKIEHGRYGVCEGCGELIPQPRLEALPYARLCIACKSGGLSRR